MLAPTRVAVRIAPQGHKLNQNAVAMVDLMLDDLGSEALEGLKTKLHIHGIVLHFDLLKAFGGTGIT